MAKVSFRQEVCLPSRDLVWGVIPKRAAHASIVAFKLWLETTSSEPALLSTSMAKNVLSIFETSEDLKPRCMKSPKPFAGAGNKGPSLKTLVGNPACAITAKAVDGQMLPSSPLAGTMIGSRLVFNAAILPDLWWHVVMTT
jgi:hypothetical protein